MDMDEENLQSSQLNGHGEREDELAAAELLSTLSQPFLQRVQNIPLVGRTMSSISNAYMTTKNSSEMLKYSAESVENLSIAFTKPVLNTLEPVLGPLDRFASHQLDRVERSFPSLRPKLPSMQSKAMNRELPPLQMRQPNGTSYRSQSPMSASVDLQPNTPARWGISKLGDDTIKALRYCLSFLKYAIDSMAHQVAVLRDFGTRSVSVLIEKQELDGSDATTSGSAMALISRVKRDVVDILRKSIDMLGKYSSSYLPVDAKVSVRSFILGLPSRLASIRAPPTPQSIEFDQSQNVEQESAKVLALATESSNMLQNIEQVISTSVAAAEYTLGHKEPIESMEDTPKLRSRYSSTASEMTISPPEQVKNSVDEDVEMAVMN